MCFYYLLSAPKPRIITPYPGALENSSQQHDPTCLKTGICEVTHQDNTGCRKNREARKESFLGRDAVKTALPFPVEWLTTFFKEERRQGYWLWSHQSDGLNPFRSQQDQHNHNDWILLSYCRCCFTFRSSGSPEHKNKTPPCHLQWLSSVGGL